MAENDRTLTERFNGLKYGPSGRSRFTIANILTLLVIIGGTLSTWGYLALEVGAAKERLGTVEARQLEDRGETKEVVKDIRNELKGINRDTMQIMDTLIRIETLQKERAPVRERPPQ